MAQTPLLSPSPILTDNVNLYKEHICSTLRGETAEEYQLRLCAFEAAMHLVHMFNSDLIPLTYWNTEIPNQQFPVCRFGNTRCLNCANCVACNEKAKINALINGEVDLPYPGNMLMLSDASDGTRTAVPKRARKIIPVQSRPQGLEPKHTGFKTFSSSWVEQTFKEAQQKTERKNKAKAQAEKRAAAKAKADARIAERAARLPSPRGLRSDDQRKLTAKAMASSSRIQTNAVNTATTLAVAGVASAVEAIDPTLVGNGVEAQITATIINNVVAQPSTRIVVLRLRPELLAQYSNTQPALEITASISAQQSIAFTEPQDRSDTLSDDTIDEPIAGPSKPRAVTQNDKRKRTTSQDSSDTVEECPSENSVSKFHEEGRTVCEYSFRTKRAKKTFHDDVMQVTQDPGFRRYYKMRLIFSIVFRTRRIKVKVGCTLSIKSEPYLCKCVLFLCWANANKGHGL